ncbi:MAG: RT0821/Lpp0805 family surface protein [Rhodospirillaceae bacterium]
MAIVLALAACETGGTKQTVGTLGGAAGGALLGSQFGSGSTKLVAVGLGTLLGAFAGSSVGKSLDQNDQMVAERATRQAYNAPIGQSITWDNPESGHQGSITPVKNGRDAQGAYCREFQQSIVVGGRTERGTGTACQQPDGSWRIVSQ